MKATTSTPHSSAHHASQAAASSGAHRASQAATAGAPPDNAFAGLMQSLAADDMPVPDAPVEESLSQEPVAGTLPAGTPDPGLPPSLPNALVPAFAAAIGAATDTAESASQAADADTRTHPAAAIPQVGGHHAATAQGGASPLAPGSQASSLGLASQFGSADPRQAALAKLPAQALTPGAQGLQSAIPPGLAIPLNAEPFTASPMALAARDAAMAVADIRRPDATGALSGAPSLTPATFDLATAGAPPLMQGDPVHEAEMSARPHEAAFAGELAAQVELMVDGDLHVAQLRLNPVDLGPIRIELRIDGTTADVVFSAAHELTREGISRSLDELRDMLASQGLSLGQAEVGTRQGGRERDDPNQGQALGHTRSHSPGSPAHGDTTASSATRPRALRGMLDLYA